MSSDRFFTHSLPDCWGHRGASAAFPENTLASFEAAIRNGSEGIESDVHVSLDNVVIMCHDPDLRRTTDQNGMIKERNWYGQDGMEHALTKKEPKQPMPTFVQTIELLMKEENKHVRFDIDIKMTNDPVKLFTLMHTTISAQSEWETQLAPRLVLGLWHPRFISHAMDILPYCRRSHIGQSPAIARDYFWDHCDSFSMKFEALVTWQGERFRRDCEASGKRLIVWTVNDPRELMEVVRWKAAAVITDTPDVWIKLRSSLEKDFKAVSAIHGRIFLWTTLHYWTPYQNRKWREQWEKLKRVGGPIVTVDMKLPEMASKAAPEQSKTISIKA